MLFYNCLFGLRLKIASKFLATRHLAFEVRGAPRNWPCWLDVLLDAPRFHFDIIEGDSILRDEEGQICPDQEAAEAEAIRTVSEMVKHDSGRLVDFERTVEVRDESAESLVRVRAVVKLEILRALSRPP
jgi:hypothetical protein